MGTRESSLEAADKRDGNPPGLGLWEDVLVDLHHEVTARRKLGHEAGVAGGLEAGEERQQEGVPGAAHSLQDPLLAVQAAAGVGFRGKETAPPRSALPSPGPPRLSASSVGVPGGYAEWRVLCVGGSHGSFNPHTHRCPISQTRKQVQR